MEANAGEVTASRAAQVPPWWTDPTKNVESAIDSSSRRQDDLRIAESHHLRELMQRDREHAREMRLTEVARVDAIRLVDVGAAARAAEVQAATQAALAAQLVATAEAARSAMAAAAVAFTQSLAAELEPMKKDIRDVRDRQSQDAGGKQQVVETRDVRGESRLNQSQIVAFALLVVAIVGLFIAYSAKK